MQIEQRIRIFVGDITQLDVDAIVTAANSALCGGGGVDGAVHSAAGPELVKASMAVAPCPAGHAEITSAFNLPIKNIIHAVGPIYQGRLEDSHTLASAYQSSLALAGEHRLERIAFPCISTGVYGFPHDEACEIAIKTVIDWLKKHEIPKIVTFCCYASEDIMLYRNRLEELGFDI